MRRKKFVSNINRFGLVSLGHNLVATVAACIAPWLDWSVLSLLPLPLLRAVTSRMSRSNGVATGSGRSTKMQDLRRCKSLAARLSSGVGMFVGVPLLGRQCAARRAWKRNNQ